MLKYKDIHRRNKINSNGRKSMFYKLKVRIQKTKYYLDSGKVKFL